MRWKFDEILDQGDGMGEREESDHEFVRGDFEISV